MPRKKKVKITKLYLHHRATFIGGVCVHGLCSFMSTCVKKKETTAVNGYLGEEIQGERQEQFRFLLRTLLCLFTFKQEEINTEMFII